MTVLSTQARGLEPYRGKVRDVYDLGDRLVLVASDRISAFDWILPNGVPDKGKILTQLSRFWLEHLGLPNHFLSMDVEEMGAPFAEQADVFAGRSMLVRKTKVVPFECVVRGYLAGSFWKEYRETGRVASHELPPGMQESQQLQQPIFTPATKATEGHDENVSVATMASSVGAELTAELERRSIDIYQRGAALAAEKGIILADCKFEFGQLPSGELLLIDEVLTPDSSRFWPADEYEPGRSQRSFDKQYVRDWLESVGFDKQSEPPEMPADVIAKTRGKYIEAYDRLTGTAWQ